MGLQPQSTWSSFSFGIALLFQQIQHRPWTTAHWLSSWGVWDAFVLVVIPCLFHRRKFRKIVHNPRSLKYSLRGLHIVLGFGEGMTSILDKLPSLQVRYYWVIFSMYGQGVPVMDGAKPREKWRQGVKGKKVLLLHVQCHQPDTSNVA